MLCRMLSSGMMIPGTMVDMMTGGEMLILCFAMRMSDFINEIDTSNLHVTHRLSKFFYHSATTNEIPKHPIEHHPQPRTS
jgi:hypothetical protein